MAQPLIEWMDDRIESGSVWTRADKQFILDHLRKIDRLAKELAATKFFRDRGLQPDRDEELG